MGRALICRLCPMREHQTGPSAAKQSCVHVGDKRPAGNPVHMDAFSDLPPLIKAWSTRAEMSAYLGLFPSLLGSEQEQSATIPPSLSQAYQASV